jgi:hypothetical protein
MASLLVHGGLFLIIFGLYIQGSKEYDIIKRIREVLKR